MRTNLKSARCWVVILRGRRSIWWVWRVTFVDPNSVAKIPHTLQATVQVKKWILFEMLSSRWSQPIWIKYASQIGSSPQVGVKTKNIWNHHLVFIHVHYGKPKAMLKRLHLQKARSHGASSFLTVPWPAPKTPERKTQPMRSQAGLGMQQLPVRLKFHVGILQVRNEHIPWKLMIGRWKFLLSMDPFSMAFVHFRGLKSCHS